MTALLVRFVKRIAHDGIARALCQKIIIIKLKASLENYFLYLDKYTSLSCFFGSRKPQW